MTMRARRWLPLLLLLGMTFAHWVAGTQRVACGPGCATPSPDAIDSATRTE